jgi:hypothetical protein
MRIVIYDDESFEPVTVVNLPGVTYRDVLSRGRKWRVAVPPRVVIDWPILCPERALNLIFPMT